MLLILFEVCLCFYYWSFISSWNHTTILKQVQLVTVFIEDALTFAQTLTAYN